MCRYVLLAISKKKSIHLKVQMEILLKVIFKIKFLNLLNNGALKIMSDTY